MKTYLVLAALLITLPAQARPTTPCDERPEGCRHGVTNELEARDSGGSGEGDETKAPDSNPTDGRDSGGGGRDSGGGSGE